MYLDDPSTEKVLEVLGMTNNSYFANVVAPPGNPVRMAFATDGVGVKSLLSKYSDTIYDTIGIDCVAMVVNDLLCVGSVPYHLSDYIALNKQNPQLVERVLNGLKEGAKAAHVDIVGGETAIVQPLGMEIDLSATAIGMFEDEEDRPEKYYDKLRLGSKVKSGDILIGLSSSGIHCNGLSFLLDKYNDLDLFTIDGVPILEHLKRPTTIYVDPILALWRKHIFPSGIYHITGGGLLNLKRIPRCNITFRIDNLPYSSFFNAIQKDARIEPKTMYKTFNMGIGMVIVVPEEVADKAMAIIFEAGCESSTIGRVERRYCDDNVGPGIVIETKSEILL